MANPDHLAILRQGVRTWNAWRDEHPELLPDLSGATLTPPNLMKVNLRRALLVDVNLSSAFLTGADLRLAKLTGSDLSGSDLSHANAARADLCSVSLSQTNLVGVNFCHALLRNASFAGAQLGDTVLADVDMSDSTGLDFCSHYRSSIIDHLTLAKSRNLSLGFLRSCGLPENLLGFMPSLLNDITQFYSCFISYSSGDQEFADRLYADLQNKGVRCWFAPKNMKGGDKLYDQIDLAIQDHDRLLLVLSESSLQSKWVETEIRRARKLELKKGRRKLFPIRLVSYEALKEWVCIDPATGEDLATELRSYFIPDFSNWKSHDDFDLEVHRLLAALRAEA